MPYELGGSICVAPSACIPAPGSGDKCPMASDGAQCITAEAQINYHVRWHRARINEWGLVTYADGMDEKYQMDAYGRVYQAGVAPVRAFGDWTAKELYARWLEVCPPARPAPCPSPSASPTPGPTPHPGPTPAACPMLSCIDGKVHTAIGPGGLLPGPTACNGCRVVLDSTPHFARCLPVWQCNQDHHQPCTADGQAHAHNPPPPAVCATWRQCEDPSGYVWRKVGGPNVEWHVQEPGPDRGYQVMIQTPVSGSYVWEVCPGAPVDAEGMPVMVGSPACGQIRFEVRPE